MSIITDIGTLINHHPDIHGGCPIIAGTGVTVRRIAIWYQQGLTAEEIVDRIGYVTLTQVYAALTYYHANQDEIEADITTETAEADRLETLRYDHHLQSLSKDISLEKSTLANYSNRQEFMKLPLEERRIILAKQAEIMLPYYQKDKEWQDLETGDLIDY